MLQNLREAFQKMFQQHRQSQADFQGLYGAGVESILTPSGADQLEKAEQHELEREREGSRQGASTPQTWETSEVSQDSETSEEWSDSEDDMDRYETHLSSYIHNTWIHTILTTALETLLILLALTTLIILITRMDSPMFEPEESDSDEYNEW